jgi:SAM-dependent methyltransferase
MRLLCLLLATDIESGVGKRFLNLACGDFYLDTPEWINLDWYPHSKSVRKANLLDPLPFPDNHFEIVYSSHFIEHIPKSDITNFIFECHRVMKPGGIIRIVVPDFENIAREYVKNIDTGKSEEAEFNIIELIDQCVRTKSGGELSSWRARTDINDAMKSYISNRTGYRYKEKPNQFVLRRRYSLREIPRKALKKFSNVYIALLVRLLPKWFRLNHINFVNTGELHRWVYDLQSLEKVLTSANFTNVNRMSATESQISEFPFFPLDIDENRFSRKGNESMYLEAQK